MAVLNSLTVSDTGYLSLPSGSCAQRPASPSAGDVRYNTDYGTTEFFDGTYWDKEVIETDLICHVDFARSDCYPGTGTTVTDISGNGNNGTMLGDVSYRNIDHGVMETTGLATSYIDFPSPSLTASNFTVMGAARYVTIGGRMFGGKTNNWLMGWSSSPVKFYSEGWVSSTDASEESDTTWRIYAGTGSISSDIYALWINGRLRVQNNGGSQGPGGLQLGLYASAAEPSNSQFGFLLVYNRVLTTAEIVQNTRAFGWRYGING
jgi:hypothetical protein